MHQFVFFLLSIPMFILELGDDLFLITNLSDKNSQNLVFLKQWTHLKGIEGVKPSILKNPSENFKIKN